MKIAFLFPFIHLTFLFFFCSLIRRRRRLDTNLKPPLLSVPFLFLFSCQRCAQPSSFFPPDHNIGVFPRSILVLSAWPVSSMHEMQSVPLIFFPSISFSRRIREVFSSLFFPSTYFGRFHPPLFIGPPRATLVLPLARVSLFMTALTFTFFAPEFC